MDADVDLDNLKNWAGVAAQAIERILLPELSKPVKLTPSEVDVLAEDVVGAAVPQNGLGIIWSVTKDGTSRPVLIAFERDAALALAGLRRDEIDRYATRREETRPFDEDEAFSLAIVGTIIADSMSAPLSEVFKGLEVGIDGNRDGARSDRDTALGGGPRDRIAVGHAAEFRADRRCRRRRGGRSIGCGAPKIDRRSRTDRRLRRERRHEKAHHRSARARRRRRCP
jgi:hypothetical protein